MAERRMLWKSISRSRKVNLRLNSLESKLLYTWSIPYLDREGLMEADAATLKATVVPLVKEITEENIVELVMEIGKVGLWEIFEAKETIYIRDPVFHERQTVHPHEAESQIIKKIKGLKPMKFSCNDNVETSNTHFPLKERKKEVKRSLKNIKENSEKDFKVLKDLSLKICDKYPKFNPYQFVQWAIKDEASCPNCLLTDIIPAFRYLDGHDRIVNPWGECRKIAEDEKRKREIIEREQSWESKKIESEDDIKKWLGTIKDIP